MSFNRWSMTCVTSLSDKNFGLNNAPSAIARCVVWAIVKIESTSGTDNTVQGLSSYLGKIFYHCPSDSWIGAKFSGFLAKPSFAVLFVRCCCFLRDDCYYVAPPPRPIKRVAACSFLCISFLPSWRLSCHYYNDALVVTLLSLKVLPRRSLNLTLAALQR